MTLLHTASVRRGTVALVLALLAGGAPLRAPADEACIDFKWDVSKERSLFASQAAPLPSGKDLKSAPMVLANRLYRLDLSAQESVAFPVAPKKTPLPGAFAGLAMLKIAGSGAYRISIDVPAWIDVVSGGSLIAASDFEGQHSCAAPHKIVEFELTGTQPFVLQFSGAPGQSLLLTVTAAPARKL